MGADSVSLPTEVSLSVIAVPELSPGLATALVTMGFALTAYGAALRYARTGPRGSATAALVAGLTGALLTLELTAPSFASWWQARPLAAGVLASTLLLGATVFLIDEVISRRDRRRWQALSRHAVVQMHEAAVAARIVTSNIWHEDPRTLAASEEAQRRASARSVADEEVGWVYDDELEALLLPPLAAAIARDPWRRTVQEVLGAVERGASMTLAQWAIVAIGEEDVSPAADALAQVVLRLEQIEWCLRTMATAKRVGWADRSHPRYEIAVDALPRLLLLLHRESRVAMHATEAFLARLNVPRLMDDRIRQDLDVLP